MDSSELVERVRLALREESPNAFVLSSDAGKSLAERIVNTIDPGLFDGTAVVVPVEPTEAMCKAAAHTSHGRELATLVKAWADTQEPADCSAVLPIAAYVFYKAAVAARPTGQKGKEDG